MTIIIMTIIITIMIMMIKMILTIVVVIKIINSPFQPGDFSTRSTTEFESFLPFNLEETSKITSHHIVTRNGMIVWKHGPS